ncbi:unnamed protein product [Phytophthora lilii]|uniref:Unnamed protein product n=1 Tax=Phytophthora lilii TaxID=2077276 RepID=A0A9W6TUK0_9STRA|nr:unnamed protein product [Phytophthora lilii]
MACTSPNQWALASPTTSSSSRSSRLHLASGDRQDEVGDDAREEQDATLLDHVRQLVVDLLLDEDARQSSSNEAAGQSADQQLAGRDAKRHSNNPEADEDVTARERLLEEKLARALMELAAEQDNLRLAAKAGNALLEELSAAREEIDTLQDELEAAQLDRDRSARDVQRLRDQNAALEAELQRYDAPYGAWDSNGQQNELSQHQQVQLQRRPSLTSRSGSFSRTDSCERCASREVEMAQLELRADELRRRCLELELAREREQQRQRELCEEIKELQQSNKDQHLETARAQQDLEFITTQLEQKTREVANVQAVRDTLRRTARRLEAENEDLRVRLEARDEHVTKLESSKARAATQLQVAENRTSSAQAETKRVTETLEQLQKQLERALLQQKAGQKVDDARNSGEVELEPSEKETDDMEQLLQDATREVAALRLENRILRRQNSSEAGSDGTRVRGRRRKTLCTGSAGMTAAEVLALGNREAKRSDTSSVSSKSDSGSDIEPTTARSSELPPLEIEAVKINIAAANTKPVEIPSGEKKKRRKMSLELSWDDSKTQFTVGTSVENTSSVIFEEKSRDSSVGSGLDTKPGDEQRQSSTVGMAPSIIKRPTALARLSHVNEHCVISGATGINSPDVRFYGVEGKQPARRSTIGGPEHARGRELAIEELKRDAAESPPKSPLYLGLSFIACATAATAAGLLVRR